MLQRAVTTVERCTWHVCHRLNNSELLELAAEKWSMGLNPCAATPGPTQDGWEGVRYRGSGRGGGKIGGETKGNGMQWTKGMETESFCCTSKRKT
jgi:hypothetical protein